MNDRETIPPTVTGHVHQDSNWKIDTKEGSSLIGHQHQDANLGSSTTQPNTDQPSTSQPSTACPTTSSNTSGGSNTANQHHTASSRNGNTPFHVDTGENSAYLDIWVDPVSGNDTNSGMMQDQAQPSKLTGHQHQDANLGSSASQPITDQSSTSQPSTACPTTSSNTSGGSNTANQHHTALS
jgi:hypothetical protein